MRYAPDKRRLKAQGYNVIYGVPVPRSGSGAHSEADAAAEIELEGWRFASREPK